MKFIRCLIQMSWNRYSKPVSPNPRFNLLVSVSVIQSKTDLLYKMVQCSHSSMFPQFYVLTVLCSQGTRLPRSIVPRVLSFHLSMFPVDYVPNRVLSSQDPVCPRTYVPKILTFQVPMVPKFHRCYVLSVLSPIEGLMFPVFYVPLVPRPQGPKIP